MELKELTNLQDCITKETCPDGKNVLLSCAQSAALQNSISDETVVFRQKYAILIADFAC